MTYKQIRIINTHLNEFLLKRNNIQCNKRDDYLCVNYNIIISLHVNVIYTAIYIIERKKTVSTQISCTFRLSRHCFKKIILNVHEISSEKLNLGLIIRRPLLACHLARNYACTYSWTFWHTLRSHFKNVYGMRNQKKFL